eukprot:6145319-Heterocapsa_arctica.AAC.1
MVRHCRAIKAGDKHGYPMIMLRLAIDMYRGQRRIAWRSTTSRPLYTDKAVVAGCGLAMHALGMVALDPMD